ncbi:hypothetical protein E4P42_07575 [Mycobacterium sp. PS03-16]|uniref:hypothetical protein n=1 Tax=Mycobacterium sp. PS03-16 TaxID=2559611 RepID=UPI001073B2A5|nr:hypothetical protein [Mycobacterium sp. PS03-16]TFV59737.1 hypothetical protein E4P42_07575 [Mycobacterium sp. PS03-16]
MRLTATVIAVLALTGATTAVAAPAHSQGPVLHHVRYTVTADAPFYADIYYRNSEPAVFSDYSHNPYMFSPKAEADIGPDRPWVHETMLADPALWAMVLVQSGESPHLPTPGFNCELAVDGVVVKTNSGPKGAVCSIRNW